MIPQRFLCFANYERVDKWIEKEEYKERAVAIAKSP